MKYKFLIVLMVLAAGCGTEVPEDATMATDAVHIYPDYAGVTVPVNIAPLNFTIQTAADKYITRIHDKNGSELTVKGKTVTIDTKQWSDMLTKAQGDSIYIDIYGKTDGAWTQYPQIAIAVAEPIDRYISYRLLEPSYVNFEEMRICQRDLESYNEDVILCNQSLAEGNKGQCINCHSYQNYNSEGNMQMHVRILHGGTVIVHDGKARKVNLKRDGLISAGVYPSWHPTLPLIAYSNNTTGQNFHTTAANKIEVQDDLSDIIMYDVATDDITVVANDSLELETFPHWAPDGRALYYVSATLPDSLSMADIPTYKTKHYRDYHYNIYRKAFDPETRSFGERDSVFDASAVGMSAILPRISPDGRWLLFTMAPYGTFHIWHHDADLYMMDLQSGEVRAVDEVNSDDTESYHSWSSTGRWVLFSSRRDDGVYTRLYIAHVNDDGTMGRPFMLPQRDPASNQRLYKSYNVPEFMVAPATDRNTLIEAIAQ